MSAALLAAVLVLAGCGSAASPVKTGGLTGLPATQAPSPEAEPSEQEEPIAGPTQQATQVARRQEDVAWFVPTARGAPGALETQPSVPERLVHLVPRI